MKNSGLGGIGFFVVLCCLFAFSPQEKHTLIVNIKGANPNEGQAVLSLFSSDKTFLEEPLVSKNKAINDKGEVSFKLELLKTGTYAISVYYDEDSDGELKTGFLGIPKELVGFSNNARGTLGPPSFEKASFKLSESQTIEITFGKAKD